MQETKIYETNINLEAHELYQNIDKLVINKLEKYYKNKCLPGGFVLEIMNIEQRSPVFMHKTSLDGNALVNVKFKYLAQVFTPGSILAGVNIEKIEQGNKILCKYDNAIIYIQADRNFNISEGTVIVHVKTVKYPFGKNMVVIIGKPFYPNPVLNISLTPQAITVEEIEILKNKTQEIAELEKTMNSKNEKLRNYFINLFFQNTPNINKELKAREFALPKASTNTNPIVIYRELGFSKKIMQTEQESILKMKNPNKLEVNIQAEHMLTAYGNFLEEYKKLVHLIISCCDFYNTETARKKSKMLFHFYENL